MYNESLKDDSYFKPLLDFLPTSFTSPYFFSDEETKLLVGSQLENEKQIRAMKVNNEIAEIEV